MEHPESTTLTPPDGIESPDGIGSPDVPGDPHHEAQAPLRRGVSIGVVVGVVVALVLTMAGVLAYQSVRGELDDRAAEIAELEETVADLETNLVNAAADRTQLQSDVAANQVELEAQAARLEAAVATGVGGADLADTVTQVTVPEAVGGLPPFGANGQPDAAIGMALPDVSGTDFLTGASVDVAADAPTLIMLWAHWCPYCQRELPMLQALYEEGLFEDKGVGLVTIATFEDETRGNPFDEYVTEFTFPVIRDDLNRAGLLGMSAVPGWLVIDADGLVLGRFTGAVGEEALRVVIDQIVELGG